MQRQHATLTPLFDASHREKYAPGCLEASWKQLSVAWRRLGAVLDEIYPKIEQINAGDSFTLPPNLTAAWGAFCNQLIRVGQEDAFQQNCPSILEDHYYQEMAFGAPPQDAPSKADNDTSEPSETMLKGKAAKLSKDHLEALPIEKRWQSYQDMKLGGQSISGRDSAVPAHISGEYVTHAYLLLWGMVRMSLGKAPVGATLPLGKAVLLDQKTVRLVLRHPLAFLNALFFLMRRSYTTALASIATTAGLILGVAGAAYYIGGPGGGWLCAGAVVALLFFMGIMSWAVPRMKRHSLALAFVPAAVLMVAGAAVVIGVFVDHRLPGWWGQVVTFLGGPNGPVGFLIGVLAATVVFGILGRSWRQRTA